jgi:uncharacterized protein
MYRSGPVQAPDRQERFPGYGSEKDMNPTRQYHGNQESWRNPAGYVAGRKGIVKKLSAIKKIIRDQKAILLDRYHVKRMGVFGSYVRGDTHSGSDVDVLVEFSEPVSLIQLISLEIYLTSIIGVKVDVVPKDDIRRELKDTILKEAVYV